MPGGIPVATVAIGGGRNAGLLAVSIVALGDARLTARLAAFRRKLAAESRARGRKLQGRLTGGAA